MWNILIRDGTGLLTFSTLSYRILWCKFYLMFVHFEAYYYVLVGKYNCIFSVAIFFRLACGDVEGHFDQIFKRVDSIQKKSGPFDVSNCLEDISYCYTIDRMNVIVSFPNNLLKKILFSSHDN